MDKNICFSLYAVEVKVGEEKTGLKRQDYHAFLALVDETPNQPPRIVEELHFTMQTKGLSEGQSPYIHAVTKSNTNRDISTLEMYGYVGGNIEVMRPVWEHALDVGYEIGRLQKEFSNSGQSDGINCRAGVKSVIDSLKLDYNPVIKGDGPASIGTKSNLISEIAEDAYLSNFEL